jgi:8-oxo-dGTP pyrophosphatase MutT (NUDIX family)
VDTNATKRRAESVVLAHFSENMSTMTPSRAVAVVLRHDRVLVIKRHRGGRDYAVLPGGGVEPGESSSEAALRELNEETTLTGEVDRLLWTGDHHGRQASYFLMKDVVGEPVLSGPEVEAHCPANSYEPAWASAEDLVAWGLQPEGVRDRVAALLVQPA